MFAFIKGLVMIWFHQEKKWKQMFSSGWRAEEMESKQTQMEEDHTQQQHQTSRNQPVGGGVSPTEWNTRKKWLKSLWLCFSQTQDLSHYKVTALLILCDSSPPVRPLPDRYEAAGRQTGVCGRARGWPRIPAVGETQCDSSGRPGLYGGAAGCPSGGTSARASGYWTAHSGSLSVQCLGAFDTVIYWGLTDIYDNNSIVSILPHVGTSSSADDVCSSVEGFFFPSPMILVIFFPAPFPTVPVFCSDFEFFFPFPEPQMGVNKTY